MALGTQSQRLHTAFGFTCRHLARGAPSCTGCGQCVRTETASLTSQACPVEQDKTWRLDHEARLKADLCLKGVGFGVDANRPEGKEKQKQRYVLSSPRLTGAGAALL